jgi:serine/threonine protein kinase
VALDEELHREVAFKEIQYRHADHPESRSRFVLEAEITGGLEHPGIVPVYGLGQYADGRPFYAMRFIKGDSLKDAIAAFHQADAPGRDPGERTLALRKLLGRFVDVCNALAYAHSRGVLHRDLKPGNVMLGQYGETLVVDWGLAKVVGRTEEASTEEDRTLRPASASGSLETVAGTAIGTPAFMSPEQAAGRLDLLGPASDVYSLGATLFCLLTGQAPFAKGDAGEVLQRVQRGDFVPPRKVKPAVPAALEAVCLKAMALKPGARYASVRALADDIDHWLADEPVAAFPEPILVRAGRWAKRHKPHLAAAAALLLAAVPLLSILYLTTEAARDKLELEQGKTKAALALATRNEETAKRNASAAEKSAMAANESAKKEKAANEQAQKRLGHIKKANDLLAGMFADINPRLEQKGGPLLLEQLKSRLEDVTAKLDADLIGDPKTTAQLQNILGVTHVSLGSFQAAIEVLQKARATREQLLGPDHPDTLQSMNNLANAYQAAGQLNKALPLLEQTLEKSKAKLGPDHPDTLTSMNNLAYAYRAAGQLDKALPLFEQALAKRKAKLGPDHPDTLTSMNNLANAYQDAGQLNKALPLFEQTLAKRKAKLGPDHPDTLTSMNNLAYAYRFAGQLGKALPIFEQALGRSKAKLGPNHPNTLIFMENLAQAYLAANHTAKAVPFFREFLAAKRKILGPDNPRYAGEIAVVALNLLKHDAKESETLLRECLAIRVKKQPDAWTTFNAQAMLGASLLGQKQYADAEPLLLKGYEGMKAREKTIPPQGQPRLTEALERLVELYERWERPEQAARWRKELAARKKTPPPAPK